MLSFLSIIPIVGPIIGSIVTGFFNTKVELAKTAATRDVAEAQVSAQIIATTNDDYCLRFLRDLYCLPAVLCTVAVGWDTLIAQTTWINHKWMWHVAPFPPTYAWYPTTVAVFLLGNIGLNMWNRK